MASATFGQRNAVQPTRTPRAARAAASRNLSAKVDALEAEARALEAEARAIAASRAIDTPRSIEPDSARKTLIGALILLLFAVVLPVAYFSELRRDATLKDTFRPDLSLRVERADCSRYLFLVTSCNVQLSWPDGNARETAKSSFLVGLSGMGGLRVVPMRSATDPAVVTSSIALDYLGNRAWTLALLPGTCLLLGLLMLARLHRGRI